MCSLKGLICDADPQGVAQSPLQSTYFTSHIPSQTFGELAFKLEHPDIRGCTKIVVFKKVCHRF
jgi:hypothetical protein